MSESTNTLAGLLLLNDARMSAIEASDVLNDAPVLRRLIAVPASSGGTLHKFLRTLTAPGVGFRGISEGITNAAGVFEEADVTCKLLDGSFSRDRAIALAYRQGPVAYMDKEGMASLRQAFFKLEQAIFGSTINKQFVGLPGNPYFDTTADGQVVNEGGAGGRSVWLLRTTEDGVAVVAGNDGRITMDPEDAIVQAVDSSNRPFTALHRSIMGWFGLQVGSKYDVVRIGNIDGTAGNVVTDDAIANAMSLFPAARQPNLIVMSRTSLKELRESRTATNPTGSPAPFPTEAFGVEIVASDALAENEATLNTTSTTTTTSTQA